MPPTIRLKYLDAESKLSIDSVNWTFGEILEKGKVLLNLSKNRQFELKYQKKPLDLSLQFRLSGILANSTVEIVDKVLLSQSQNQAPISVALDFEGTRLKGSFPSNTKLSDIISMTCSDDIQARIVSVRYLNKNIESSEFITTTLLSLGINQGSALFRLQSNAPFNSSTPPPITVSSTTTTNSATSPPSPLAANLSGNELSQAIVTLMKIIRNVYQNPTDVKLRQIRLSNPAIKSKLKDSPYIFEVLIQAGFVKVVKENEPYFILDQVENEKLEKVFFKLNKICDDLEIIDRPTLTKQVEVLPSSQEQQQEFDVFKTNVIGLNNTGGPQLRIESSNIYTLEQQVNALKKKRDDMLLAHAQVTNRNIIAFRHSEGFNPRKFQIEDDDEEEEGEEELNDYDQQERAAIAEHHRMMKEKQKKAENFQTKAMKEHDELVKSKVYTRTLIRVVFPNRTVLQALPLETIEEVCKVISSTCSSSANQFFLLTGPPPQRLDPKATLLSLGLIPAASLQLSCQEKLEIKEEFFSQDNVNSSVPKGEYLVPRTTTSGGGTSVGAKPKVGGKPKWLKL